MVGAWAAAKWARPYLVPPVALDFGYPLDFLGSAYVVGPSVAWTQIGGYAPSWFMDGDGYGRWRVYDVTHGRVLTEGSYTKGLMSITAPIRISEPAVVVVQVLGAAVRFAGLL